MEHLKVPEFELFCMMLIREFEMKVAEMFASSKLAGIMFYLSVGQEVISDGKMIRCIIGKSARDNARVKRVLGSIGANEVREHTINSFRNDITRQGANSCKSPEAQVNYAPRPIFSYITTIFGRR